VLLCQEYEADSDALAGDVRNARIVAVSLNVITASSQAEE
jgi:hypothetical protein